MLPVGQNQGARHLCMHLNMHLIKKPHLISCTVGELRPHPSYARHRLTVDSWKLSALADRGDLALSDPIAITQEKFVIDGYARWEVAKRTGRRMLDCFVYELSSDEALEELIRTHCASRGLTDFVRIELALDLEPHFQVKALKNQRAGGQGKGLSKLTKAQRLDTRREVARVADVSSGNVRKVKNILTHGCSSLLQAAREAENHQSRGQVVFRTRSTTEGISAAHAGRTRHKEGARLHCSPFAPCVAIYPRSSSNETF